MKRSRKRFLSLILSLVLVLTSFSGMTVFAQGTADWEKESSAVTELVGNTYVIVLSGTGTKNRVNAGRGTAELSGADVAVSHNLVCDGGAIFDYEACDDITDATAADYQWTIESDGNGGYYFRAVGIENDNNAYMNLANGSATLGGKQSLTITADADGNTGTYQIASGSNKLRFTNSYSYNSVTYDGFTAANKAASSYLELYTYEAAEVTPPDNPPEGEKTIMYTRVTSLNDLNGTFVLGMEGIGPTTGEGANQEGLSVAAKNNPPADFPQNLDYAIFNGVENEENEGLLWDVEPYENGYSIKVSGGDDNSYLRIDGTALTFGEAQALTIALSDGYFNVSNGSNYLRFTNSYNSTSCFTAGTSVNSRSVIFYKVTETTNVEIAPPEGEPIFTLAAISDLHTDAGIEGWEEPIRGSVTLTTKAIYENEDADVILLGGDLTSAHMGSSWGSTDAEKIANFKAAQNAIIEAAESATDSHRVLYATGNHDFATGLKTFNSGDYIDAQEKYLPKLIDAKNVNDVEANAYFQKSMPSGTAAGVKHVLAYHYNIEGLDFIVLNTPYTGADKHNDYDYDEDSLTWIGNKLDAIGKDKTVFFIAHYPLNTDKNLTSGKGVNAATQAVLKEKVLDEYPNAIYLYGHDHGGYKIVADTYERVTTYDESGNSYENRYVMPSGFVSSFVGSMSYYGTGIVPTSLGNETPNVIQGLMVYVYEDRIVFQMKNYGEADMGSYVLKEYTLLRDMDLEVDNTITGIRLQEDAEVIEGETLQLTATVLPLSAPERGVTWKSSDDSIAAVDANGLVTAKKTGEVTITATAVGDTSISAECKLTVYVPEPIPEVLADFNFDTDGAFFDGGYAKAEGTYSLVDYNGGKALKLDGNGQFLTLTNKDGGSLLTGVDELTVSFQFNPESSATNWGFFAAPNTNQQQYQSEKYIGVFDNNGAIGAERYYSNSEARPANPSTQAGYGSWYHVTVVFTETETILYLNGEEAAREASIVDISDLLGENSVAYIGKSTWLASGEYYTGLIDNYKIYSRVLTAEEVAKLAAQYIDKTALTDAIAAAEAITGEDKYTPGTWEAFQNALTAAKAVAAKEDASQTEINDAASALTSAANALREKANMADLQAKVDEAEKLDAAKYTEETWEKVAAEIEDAKEVLANAEARQTAVDSALRQLNNAIEALELKGDVPTPTPTPEPFQYEDITADDWFHDAAYYTRDAGVITGLTDTTFGPYVQLSRAQFAVMLHRLAGTPEVETDKTFKDIAGGEWYGAAVLWAAEAGVVNGYENGCFGPADNITREQMAVMMYRYAEYLEKDITNEGDLSKFSDGETVSPFAKDALKWAADKGIITGKGTEEPKAIDPQGNTARAEAAVIIERFMNAYAE